MKTAVKPGKLLKQALSFIIVISLVISTASTTLASSINSGYKCYVMGPLEKVTDFTAFKNELVTLKKNGVYGITTDVWWDMSSRQKAPLTGATISPTPM